jgi:hypothetical protein
LLHVRRRILKARENECRSSDAKRGEQSFEMAHPSVSQPKQLTVFEVFLPPRLTVKLADIYPSTTHIDQTAEHVVLDPTRRFNKGEDVQRRNC